uniref:Myb/SANT-like DNA-binding domain-containing protein n=1 Tax=Aegilops tauschii TaxID=37682 RepID=N1R4P7_AEGTA
MPSSKASPGAPGPWSDGETSALVDAWGPLYLRRDPDPLGVEDWRVVCSAVNAQRAAEGCRFNRTLVQCQKRVYTLKDQYMKELAKGRPASGWRHFARLRAFLAASPPGFVGKRPAASVKKEKAAKTPTASSFKSGARPAAPPAPPGFGGKRPAASVKKEKAAKTPTASSFKKEKAAKTPTASSVKEEEEVQEASPGFQATMPATVKNEEVVGCGCELVGRARCCPGAVVTKLAGVYERVQMRRLNVEEKRMEKISCCSLGHKKMKIENPEETDGN